MMRKNLRQLEAQKKQWEARILPQERKDNFVSASDLPVERLYTPLDIASSDYIRDSGFPGEYPYTRGAYPTMYRGRL